MKRSYGCNVVSSSLNTVNICLSKEKTYIELKEFDFVPKVYEKIDDVKYYPVFVKPKIGYGAIGTKIVNNENELKSFLQNSNNDNLILEYLTELYISSPISDPHGNTNMFFFIIFSF